MALANLPGRNERSAPKFDESQPDELDPYFADIQDLLDRHAIVDDAECKQAAVKYLKTRTASLWKTTEAWADATKTYDDFKAEVFRLYPGATGDRTYTLQDLDLIIGHYARSGILSATDLGEYYRRFILVSRYLISKGRLASQEQSRSFFRGLQTQLEAKTRERLQQKFVNHFPDDPYELNDIYEAVSYVLMGTASSLALVPAAPTQPTTQPSPDASTSPVDANTVKIEALTAAVASLGEMFKISLQSQQAGGRPRNIGATATGTGVPGTSVCNFCGAPGHFIRECEAVAEFTRAGKCKRSPEGKVVLPSGAMVPRSITGNWLRDRVDEYHRQNPGQMAAQMLFEVATTVATPRIEAASQSYVRYPATEANQFSISENVARAYALHRPSRLRPEVVITTRPPRHSGRVGLGENAGGADSEAAPQVRSEEAPPPMTQETETSTAKKGKQVEFAQEPTHPYAAIPDAIHKPVAGPAKPAIKEPAVGRHDPAYTTTTKAYDPRIAKIVYERAMETPITVTQRELLSLSPEVRAQIADITVKKRMAREQAAMVMIEDCPDEDEDLFQQAFEKAHEAQKTLTTQVTQATHMPAAFAAAARIPPVDATIIADPYEAYLRESSTNTKPTEPVRVAAESNALRAILPVVDGQDKVEAILDPGCQIVAMSEEVCNALALPYDPTIRLNMVSANGGVNQSLGLARNIPFLVGDITLYLQVHVLRDPAYDILLGRPFDVLTQSVVRNYPDENQTVTILDPNTNRKTTVPTIQRGSFKFGERRTIKNIEKSQDF
jgi:hypothetical protein